jgi:hypothetical protein
MGPPAVVRGDQGNPGLPSLSGLQVQLRTGRTGIQGLSPTQPCPTLPGPCVLGLTAKNPLSGLWHFPSPTSMERGDCWDAQPRGLNPPDKPDHQIWNSPGSA